MSYEYDVGGLANDEVKQYVSRKVTNSEKMKTPACMGVTIVAVG